MNIDVISLGTHLANRYNNMLNQMLSENSALLDIIFTVEAMLSAEE